MDRNGGVGNSNGTGEDECTNINKFKRSDISRRGSQSKETRQIGISRDSSISAEEMRNLLGSIISNDNQSRRFSFRKEQNPNKRTSVMTLGTTVSKSTYDSTWDDDDTNVMSGSQDEVIVEENKAEKNKNLATMSELNWWEEFCTLTWYIIIALVLLIPGIFIGIFMDPYYIQGLKIALWAASASIAVASYPFLQLLLRIVGAILASSRFAHNSHVYFFVRLCPSFGSFLWSVLMYNLWDQFVSAKADLGKAQDIILNILACHLAYRTTWVLKDFVVLELAYRNLWAPYLARVQASIFAQYTVMILSDFAVDGRRCASVDQEVALKYASNMDQAGSMSLFAISKAISFVPNKCFSGSSQGKNVSISNKRTAQEFAISLFDSLVNQCRLQNRKGYPKVPSGKNSQVELNLKKGGSVLLPMNKRSAVNDYGVMKHQSKPSFGAAALDSLKSTIGLQVNESEFVGVTKLDPIYDDELDEEGEAVLTIESLKPAMCKPLAKKIMELLDANGNGEVTEDEFVAAIVNMYRNRKSLSLSLKDYEIILLKLSYMLSAGFGMLLLFIFMWIFGQSVIGLGVSWVSFLLAFSFVFSSSAQALCESVIFVFVTRPYDIGDAVHFNDDMNRENVYSVQRINLLSTIFKRWDGQYVVFPNRNLAHKEIRNMRRSEAQSNVISIVVRRDASLETLLELQEQLRIAARAAPRDHTLIPDSISASFRSDLYNGSGLEVIIFYSQTQSWQDNKERWRTQTFMFHHIVALRASLNLLHTNAPQPVLLQEVQQGNPVLAREINSSGEGHQGGPVLAREINFSRDGSIMSPTSVHRSFNTRGPSVVL